MSQEESGWTSIGCRKLTKSKIEAFEPELDSDSRLLKLLEIAKNRPSEECDQWHISQEVFDLINENYNRELTIFNGKPKDTEKLLNDLLKKLFQDRLNKSKDRWPDGKCYYREILSESEGFCYENSPRPPYRIKPKSCWACLIRKKKLRLESRVHTANGVQAYKSVESECQYHRLPNWCGKSGGTCSGTECIYHPRHEDRDQGSPRTW